MPDRVNPNSLSYWFPRLEAAGLPVPKTVLVEMPKPTWEGYLATFDGSPWPDGATPEPFFDQIGAAAEQVGWPAFLRTDHTSHKHDWAKTCFLEKAADIQSHIWELIEFSEMASWGIDLSWDRWAVREMLPTIKHGTCPAYGGMPICREFRFFVDDGVMRCFHPYWPPDALLSGGATFANGKPWSEVEAADFGELTNVHEFDELHDLATRAGAAVGGSWSVDILETERGWFVTDMAVADDSFHWEGCPHDRSQRHG